jgi:two-component system LytT family response regulator
MKILVIEDELAALSCLMKDLENKQGFIKVLAYLHTVENTMEWLQHNPQPDLILMDIHLSDGPTSIIFKSFALTCPIILMTDDLRQLNESLEYNSIGYLMKPVNPEKLDSAIRKYQLFRQHFAENGIPERTECRPGLKKKSRILVKQGTEYHAVKVEDIGYFYTEGRLIFVVNKDNRKLLAEKTNLSDLSEELDPNLFYRANRKYIINANFIKRFMPIDRNKLSVELTLPLSEEIIISQENAPEFKKWIKEETAETGF